MSLAPWRSPLARALHRNRAAVDARYFQLATIDREGCPDNRTVVFRGFQDGSDRLKIITDARSEKISHLNHCAKGAIAWYFRKTREQFRLRGTVQIIDHTRTDAALTPERQHTWESLSDAARCQFAWPLPKAPKADAAQFEVTVEKAIAPETFVLLLFEPSDVDHLELRGEPQNRTLYRYVLDNAIAPTTQLCRGNPSVVAPNPRGRHGGTTPTNYSQQWHIHAVNP